MLDHASDFSQDPRRQQELAARPCINRIYRYCFGDDISIERGTYPGATMLDKLHSIDGRIVFKTRQILTFQEKALSYKYAKFDSLTVEYEQDAKAGEMGDWNHMAAQIVFCGYLTEDCKGFSSWLIVDWTRLVLATVSKRAIWQSNKNSDNKARASFRYIRFSDVPDDCILRSDKSNESDFIDPAFML